MRSHLLALLAVLALPAAASAAEPLDVVPLGRTPALGEAQAEISAFDPKSEKAFVTNAEENRLDIYDFSDPSAPTFLEGVDLSPFGGGPNSVAVRKKLVAVAVEADDKTDPGSVEFFDTDGDHLCGVTVGALPDMLTFTDSGKQLLVANEGEPSDDGLTDPEGGVSVVDVQRGACKAKVKSAGFDGVPLLNSPRVVTPGNTPERDFEPEYIVNEGSLAWVTIQEANAIGVLHVPSARFLYVRGLGYKDHGLAENALDPSDRDGGANINPWSDLFGMYQPDAIAGFFAGGRFRLVTANEGDARENDAFAEESRVNELDLDDDVFADGEEANDKLGRLTVTTTQGDDDGDGDYDRLFAFGGRSMSVLNAFGVVRFDTGDELERFVALTDPGTFNVDNAAGSATDNRSDNKGPEPEGVAVGRVGDATYAFLVAERQGGIFAYDLSAEPGEAELAGYTNTRPDDLGPEGASFVSAKDSPTAHPLLFVTNEISGTVAVYELRAG